MMRYLSFLLLAACACPPPPAATPMPPARDEEQRPDAGHDHHHDAKKHHAHDGDGPLVHRFTEGGEHWRKRFEDPERDASQKPQDVVAAMGLTAGMTVADIGAGTGYFMQYLSAAVGAEGRVYAVDIEPTMVRYLHQRAREGGHANVEVKLALTDDPLLRGQSLDRILIVNTWHHIPKREAYAAKLREALEPGGQIWIVDFNMETERGPNKDHRLKPEVVIAELKSAGLETRLDEELLPDQYIAIGERPAP